jgi:8-oxo-dGTP diphosphatase
MRPSMPDPKRPSLTVDAIIEYPGDRVVLIKRGFPPFKGLWALPGGFVDYGETVESACLREVMEECSIAVGISEIFGAYSEPGRDPRRHTVSIVFKTKYLSGELKGSDDAAQARLFSRDELQNLELAFDHCEILHDAGWI